MTTKMTLVNEMTLRDFRRAVQRLVEDANVDAIEYLWAKGLSPKQAADRLREAADAR